MTVSLGGEGMSLRCDGICNGSFCSKFCTEPAVR